MTVLPSHVDPALVREFDYHTDPAFLADPFAGFDRVRDRRTFFSPGHGGYWVLTRAEDIRTAFQQPDLFSSAEFAIPTGVYPRTLRPLALDPPDHGNYRRPLAPLFSPPSVAQREPVLRSMAADLIARFADQGATDLIPSLIRPFPTTVFVSMLGLPLDDAAVLEAWNHDLLHAYDEPERRAGAAKHILGYLDEVVARRMAEGPHAADDLFSVLLQASVDGRALDRDELLDYAFMLFIAGLDTVTAILGFSLQQLAHRPDLQSRLLSDPALVPAAVEELLRAHAIVNPARVVTRDVEFAGVSMRKGDRVLLATALASRDPLEFDHPESIDIDRQSNRHLAFGAGPHRCLGSHLARLEMRIVIEELLPRVSPFRMSEGSAVVIHGGGVLGVDSLPVRWGPETP
ncbi:MAG TPA: cytochrome P450 [Acidimicrobiales bacterium]|nr:cytochrome P450 [Acidimicrobiales bacterium]